jgi:hypothetical protein
MFKDLKLSFKCAELKKELFYLLKEFELLNQIDDEVLSLWDKIKTRIHFYSDPPSIPFPACDNYVHSFIYVFKDIAYLIHYDVKTLELKSIEAKNQLWL